MTTSTGTAGPDIRSEVTLAFAAVLGGPWRVVRFAGLPFVLCIALFAWLFLTSPPPAEATPVATNQWVAGNSGYLIVGSLLALWGYGRFLVRWYRWTVLGEDSVSFVEPGLGRRELRTISWTIVVGLATIPAMILLTMMAGALAFIGRLAFGMAGASEFGAGLGAQLGSLLGFYLICYVMARLGPGVVDAALDGTVGLGRSWRATAPIAAVSALILWFLALPANLLGVIRVLTVAPMDGLIGVLEIPVNFAVYAASAIFTARLWQATLAPRGAGPVAALPHDQGH